MSRSYKSGYAADVSDNVPGFIGHDHFDKNVSGEYFGFDFTFFSSVGFYNDFRRNSDIRNKIAETSVLDYLFQIGFNFVFVARISMRNIPTQTFVHLINIAHRIIILLNSGLRGMTSEARLLRTDG